MLTSLESHQCTKGGRSKGYEMINILFMSRKFSKDNVHSCSDLISIISSAFKYNSFQTLTESVAGGIAGGT